MAGPKFVMVIPDGASDEPVAALGDRTALQAARLPAMDEIARTGVVGLAKNVPDRFLPGSDVATLSLLGYDPEQYYTGRAPLEAAAMGVALGPEDWAVRCNLMTIDSGRLTDFTAGHITNEEGKKLIEALAHELASPGIEFHAGVSYRNLAVFRGARAEFDASTVTDPPHDHPDQPAAEHRPRGAGARLLIELMQRAEPILRDHPVNRDRITRGKRPASAIWLWGQGRAPQMPPFRQIHGLSAAMISAVDLVRGVARLADWARIDVPGATGYLDTDYAAKGAYAVRAIAEYDFVCVHIEAPDEASHEGRADAKVEALEQIDRHIVAPVLEALQQHDQWRIVITPDHSTLLRTRAHDRAPAVWTIAGTGIAHSGLAYDEFAPRDGRGPSINPGWKLMEHFLNLAWDGRTSA